MLKKRKKLSAISVLHYTKLILRSCLFLAMLVFYVLNRTLEIRNFRYLPAVAWIFFVVEMIFRFFPSKFESMGCQKQFKRNFKPTETKKPKSRARSTVAVALAWAGLNAIIGLLYLFGIIDGGIILLICLAFSVCDIICILFFCPFQTWFMKNRCCTTCRIYNWDYAMMFTPLLFVPNTYTYSLLGCALLLLFRWEITYYKFPERFSEDTNACLDCSNCKEKLCSHKKQLRGFLMKNRKKFFKKQK